MTEDRPGIARELHATLTAAASRSTEGREVPEEVRILTDRAIGHVVPWELALEVGARRPRRLSRGHGRAHARDALARARAAAASTSDPVGARAVVVAPAVRVEDLARRSSVDWLREAVAAYASAGFDAEAVELRPGQPLPQLMRERPATVLHVQAPFVDVDGAPAIDLAGTSTARALHKSAEKFARALHATLFESMLADAIAGAPAPVLVLEPPCPVEAFEVGRQLCLRNAFAGTLFESRLVESIVACGVLERNARRASQVELASALASGNGVGSVVDAVRMALAGHGDSLLGASALALFCAHPDIPAPQTPAVRS